MSLSRRFLRVLNKMSLIERITQENFLPMEVVRLQTFFPNTLHNKFLHFVNVIQTKTILTFFISMIATINIQ